jgi:hypothetical protein
LAPSDRITLPSGRNIFVSGMNLAWINYANDVGNTPLDTGTFKTAVQDIRDAGGNAMRVWLSTNGSHDPVYDSSTGLVKGLGTQTISNVKAMLDIAGRNGVVLVLSLLSQNLAEQPQTVANGPGQIGLPLAFNKKLLQTDTGLSAYIRNAVVPLVTAIGKDSSILCWEVFNEPEGMTDSGWTYDKTTTIPEIQKVINRVAGAIHRAVPGILVSNSAVTFATSSNVGAYRNVYSDSALKVAGGDSDGTLDFYMVHYYPWNQGLSPFVQPASHWKLDKPLVIAEFPAGSWGKADSNLPPSYHPVYDSADIDTLFQTLYNTGYAGAISWNYFGDTYDTWLGSYATSMKTISDLYTAHTSDIEIAAVTRVKPTGNGVLRVTYDNDTAAVWTSLHHDTTGDLSRFQTISVDVLVPRSAEGTFQMHWVLKTKAAWEWDISDNFCTIPNDSAWHTCTATLSTIHYYQSTSLADLTSVHSLYMNFGTTSTFHGDVWFDNVRLDNDTLNNFNDGKPLFAVDASNANEAAKVTAGPDVIFPYSTEAVTGVATHVTAKPNLVLLRTSSGISWQLTSPLTAKASLRLSRLDGRQVAVINMNPGSSSGSWSGVLPAGLILASLPEAGVVARVIAP